MTSIKQIEANKRNALRSTGPSSDQGKRRSRCNAIRHGLTAETVISQLEDRDDYQRFEASVTADYAVETAVERELVLRLASLLWRLRRASAIETCLFELNAPCANSPASASLHSELSGEAAFSTPQMVDQLAITPVGSLPTVDRCPNVTASFLKLMELPNVALDRLSRCELNLWRQASQIIFTLSVSNQRRHQNIRAIRRNRTQ